MASEAKGMEITAWWLHFFGYVPSNLIGFNIYSEKATILANESAFEVGLTTRKGNATLILLRKERYGKNGML